MIVPFGFSVGDFIATLEFIQKAIAGLKAQGGALDEFHHIIRELENNALIFQYLESTTLPDKYISEQKAIVAQAQALNGLSKDFKATIQKYSVAFGKKGAEKFYHSIVAKTRWTATMAKQIAQYRVRIQEKSQTLQLLLATINL